MLRSVNLILILLFSFLNTSCLSGIKFQNIESDSKPITHEIFNELLKKHVSTEGKVNYKGFLADKQKFDSYLDLLREGHPNDKNWSKDEQLTYWINAYNAFTIDLILQHYPVESILKIGGLIKIPGIASAWDIKFVEIEGHTYALNELEHEILRKEFNEPRIHFAIVCASVSCPNLRNEAYTSSKINEQLHDQSLKFVNDLSKNKITINSTQLSKIFDWFKEDFTKSGSIIDFLNQYSTVKISPKAKTSFLDYNWNLNE